MTEPVVRYAFSAECDPSRRSYVDAKDYDALRKENERLHGLIRIANAVSQTKDQENERLREELDTCRDILVGFYGLAAQDDTPEKVLDRLRSHLAQPHD